MVAKPPNVLLISIDALRADRVGFLGYQRPTTPNMDRLAANGLVCSQMVSCAAFTQASFHSFMSSSKPLSHGGFDSGKVGRPPSLFKAFHDAGYKTHLLATFAWVSKYFGYGDGVDFEDHLFLLVAFIGIHGGGTMASTLRAWHKGDLTTAEAVSHVGPLIEKVFADIENYCHARMARSRPVSQDFPNSPVGNEGYNYKKVLAVLARHRAEYRADNAAYLERHLRQVPKAHEWIATGWRYARTPAKLLGEAFFRGTNALLGRFNPKLADLRANRLKRYPDAYDLVDRLLRDIDTRQNPDKPFLMWTHFIDTHVPYCAGRGKRWYRETPRYLASLGYPGDMDISITTGGAPTTDQGWATWSALYDASVAYVDEQIGRLVEGLAAQGRIDDTLIVITGDHGEELGEHGDISHHFRLHDHNIHVPLVIHGPGIEAQRIDHLTTLLDLAPTLASLTGIAAPADWQGVAVTDPAVAERDHVVLETFHGGSCLFDSRPPYMAVRTKKWKYLWREYIDPTDRFSSAARELFDIEADPMEQNNLYRDDHPVIAGFNQRIAERLAEIPEFDNARIDKAFGPGWRNKETAA